MHGSVRVCTFRQTGRLCAWWWPRPATACRPAWPGPPAAAGCLAVLVFAGLWFFIQGASCFERVWGRTSGLAWTGLFAPYLFSKGCRWGMQGPGFERLLQAPLAMRLHRCHLPHLPQGHAHDPPRDPLPTASSQIPDHGGLGLVTFLIDNLPRPSQLHNDRNAGPPRPPHPNLPIPRTRDPGVDGRLQDPHYYGHLPPVYSPPDPPSVGAQSPPLPPPIGTVPGSLRWWTTLPSGVDILGDELS